MRLNQGRVFHPFLTLFYSIIMTAKYHQSHSHSVLLDVIKTHADGSVDLGIEGVSNVTKVPVLQSGAAPQPGHAELVPESEDARAKAEADAKAKAEADAKAKAEADAKAKAESKK